MANPIITPAPSPTLATVSRPALLADGSDAAFRRLIHGMLSYTHHVETVRDGFATLIGVTGIQYVLLMSVQRLQASGGISVSDVATWMRRSGAFITIEAGKLVQAGLIEKAADRQDRRRVLLRLTADGASRLASLAPRQQQLNDTLFEALDAAEFTALASLMEKLLPCGRRAADLIDYIVKQPDDRAA
jgi:DNA-binding MarR family transcriptional regulator